MTQAIDDILRDVRAQVDQTFAEALPKIRAALAEDVAKEKSPLENATVAFNRHFPFSADKVRNVCKKYRFDPETGTGFAQKVEGSWYVRTLEFSIWVHELHGSKLDFARIAR